MRLITFSILLPTVHSLGNFLLRFILTHLSKHRQFLSYANRPLSFCPSPAGLLKETDRCRFSTEFNAFLVIQNTTPEIQPHLFTLSFPYDPQRNGETKRTISHRINIIYERQKKWKKMDDSRGKMGENRE